MPKVTENQKVAFKALFDRLCKVNPSKHKDQIIAALHMTGGYFSLANRLLKKNLELENINEDDKQNVFTYNQDCLILESGETSLETNRELEHVNIEGVRARLAYLTGREHFILSNS